MTPSDKDRLLNNFHNNSPVSSSAVTEFVIKSGVRFPDEYIDFLCQMNGGEGFVGRETYVMLWPLEDLLDLNEAYQVTDYAPGLLLFGSDGGGEAFDLRSDTKPIVSVPFVGMDLSLVRPVAQSFSAFLYQLFNS